MKGGIISMTFDESKHKRDSDGKFAKTNTGKKVKIPQPTINIQLFANKNLSKMGIVQLNKSIRSLTKKIDEHENKIQNPKSSYGKEWDSFDGKRKIKEIKKWQKEIKAFRRNINEAMEEIKRRQKNE